MSWKEQSMILGLAMTSTVLLSVIVDLLFYNRYHVHAIMIGFGVMCLGSLLMLPMLFEKKEK